MEDTNNDFEQVNSGSSHTYPQQAGAIRKGMYIMIKGRPCRVNDVSTSKTGKHGHAKNHFVTTDIFTGKRLEEISTTSHNMDVPYVSRKEYQVIDAPTDDDFISLCDSEGTMKEDLKFPDDLDLKKSIIDKYNSGDGDVFVTSLCAIGEEKIIDVKINK